LQRVAILKFGKCWTYGHAVVNPVPFFIYILKMLELKNCQASQP
jgi:hypothetical protein